MRRTHDLLVQAKICTLQVCRRFSFKLRQNSRNVCTSSSFRRNFVTTQKLRENLSRPFEVEHE